ncbi:hypothetical protein UNPF46_23910 [Bradyrhizobium sp. UNPF46]|nr:hypothetical protein UNPF46_23910 [Bradyrhizobium sp. UNPF46]
MGDDHEAAACETFKRNDTKRLLVKRGYNHDSMLPHRTGKLLSAHRADERYKIAQLELLREREEALALRSFSDYGCSKVWNGFQSFSDRAKKRIHSFNSRQAANKENVARLVFAVVFKKVMVVRIWNDDRALNRARHVLSRNDVYHSPSYDLLHKVV